jgi:hypothetical protein
MTMRRNPSLALRKSYYQIAVIRHDAPLNFLSDLGHHRASHTILTQALSSPPAHTSSPLIQGISRSTTLKAPIHYPCTM